MKKPAKDLKGLLPSSQPDPKCGQLGLIKPHAEGRAPSAPWADLCSQPSPAHLDTKSALYAGEKLMPKLVTAESCVGEGIPDPQSNDNIEVQPLESPWAAVCCARCLASWCHVTQPSPAWT